MSHHRPARLLGSVAALGAIVALLAVPPWALSRYVGWPLPDAVPTVNDLAAALRGPIPDTFVVKALACICWLAWALLASCLVTEIISTLTRQVARAVPLAGLVQPLARQLVVSASLLISLARPAAAAPRPVAAPITVPFHPVGPGDPADAPPTAETPKRTCVVASRDSLWRLAERHLGDGLRWREIWELNRGSTMNGGRTFQNPNLIRPGWELILPPTPDAGPMAFPEAVRPAPPDADQPDPPDVAASERGTAPEVPGPAGPTVSAAPSATSSAPGPTPTSPDHPGEAPALPDADDGTDDPSPVPLALAGATLVAAGIVATIGRLRGRQQRHRAPGHTILTPSGSTAKAERKLRIAADTEGADRLDAALRTLGGLLAGRPGADDTRIEVVQVDADAIEILLTQPVTADPGPFNVVGGRLWRLPTDVPTHDLACDVADRGCLAPALVSIGHRDGTQVLIDLEHPDPLVLEGDDADTTRVLTSVALDLATNAWADDVRLLVHGDLPEGLAGLDRIEPVPDLEQLPEVLRSTAAAARSLGQLGYPSTWSGRLANSGEGWPPTVLLVGPGAGQERLSRLLNEADATPGLAVVGAISPGTDLPAGRRLQVNPDGSATLQPLGLDLSGTGLEQDLLECTADLLGVAQSLEPGEPLDLDDAPGVSDRPAPTETSDPTVPVIPGSPDDPDRIIVRVLGPVEIEGGAAPVARRMSRELIVLLALHPKGRTEAQIKDALWPDQLPKANTFNQTISRARTALGTNQAGELHIPHVCDGNYRISAHVVTDADLMEQTLRRTRTNPDDEHLLRELSAQLAEARAPFEGTKGYEWAYEKAIPARMAAILDEARRLVEDRATLGETEKPATSTADP